ncbi:hypothetical protein P4E94_19945, partial [Pontiellaceae bacterium B12219]|nr:hypothetical protein [Pontiellaceae bacterium B12219]
MNKAIPIPDDNQKWLAEISAAYLDAYESIPFGKITGSSLSEENLFQLAPHVCLKFRSLKNKKNEKLASDAALCSYVATKDQSPEIFESPQMSFAFCYLL